MPNFPMGYAQGIQEAVWYCLVTVTTVGYGDRVAKNTVARLVTAVWMMIGFIALGEPPRCLFF
jgi:polar amino acid transport system substrate-binding protein